MEIIHILPEIILKSEKKLDELLSNISSLGENSSLSNDDSLKLLYHGDNIDAMLDLLNKGYGTSIDLIYIDPPFFTKANYNNRVEIVFQGKKEVLEYKAYEDVWKGGLKEYLEELTIRLMLMKELLSDKGTIYVHIDFRTVHYIKVIMDNIFGIDNFLNEVIWAYKSGGTSNKYYSRKHDNILVYTKTNKYIFNPQKEKSYNRGFKPYRFKGVKEYQDSLGWYTLVNLKDVWQIDMVGRTSSERVGYETQKPEVLLERIILSSSNEDSIVADFYSGSGTTLSVAQKLNRRWIGSDKGNCSMLTIMKRLGQIGINNYKKINLNKVKNTNDTLIKYDILVDNGKYMIDISEYKFNLEMLKFSRKDSALIEEILKKDSLALIDYVCIKTEDDKIVYEDFKTKSKERVSTNIKFETDNFNKIYLTIIDIFGNLTCMEVS